MKQTHPAQKLKNRIHKLQSQLATARRGNPGKKLTLIGVTGTDGKTTVTTMIYHVLKEVNFPVGYISTISAKFNEKEIDTGFHVTTPDPWDVPKYLKMMVSEGVKIAVIEATSNGLQQNRLHGLMFDSAVITNIRYDHLDYHGTWENYAEAKFTLVHMVKDKGLVVLNKDDSKSAEWMSTRSQNVANEIFVKWVSFSDLKNVKQSLEGIRFSYLDTDFFIPIIGEHNFINALQVINICLRYAEIENIQKALKSYKAPEGRMQVMQTEPFGIIVDFAHTPGALESALESLNKVNAGNSGKVINVFGCAGKRDKSRRQMGRVSAELADVTILTAEDPRDEKLSEINDEIISHMNGTNYEFLYRFANHEEYLQSDLKVVKENIEKTINLGKKPVIAFDEDSIRSRYDAIDFATKIAEKGDIVFITGKGHEKSLSFTAKEVEYPWSDQQAVGEIIGN